MASGHRAGTPDAGLPEDPDSAGARPPSLIPHSRPLVGEPEIEALTRVVESGMLSQGPRVEELEVSVATLAGVPDASAVALSSGTAALYAALHCLDVGAAHGGDEDDEVLIPAYACTSLAQAVRWAGATPRFIDCRPDGWNADPDDAAAKVTHRTRAVIVAHLFGLPADVEAFRHGGVTVIEDCAQTLGVEVSGRPVGSRGDLTVFSFYATKLVAGGEGGMLVCRDPGRAEVARGLRDCEADRADERAFNFKTSDLHAAVALAQLGRLPGLLERRRELARRYRTALEDLPLELPRPAEDGDHAWFRFVVDVGDRSLEDLLARAEARGLACRRPVGRLPAGVHSQLDTLPGCRAAWDRACSIPLYPGLDDAEVEAVLDRFRTAFEETR